MDHPTQRIRIGTVDEIKQQGAVVVAGQDRPLAVFYHQDQIYAVDNRCPHMGFPLHRGTTQDGILTCHWHHARFDLASGCTFDLWADDIPSYPVEIDESTVWVVMQSPTTDGWERWQRRLREGMGRRDSQPGILHVHVQYRVMLNSHLTPPKGQCPTLSSRLSSFT